MMPDPLYALTLRHPWAFAITHLGKDVENRIWRPPEHLLGQRIAIHGGVIPKGQGLVECETDVEYILDEIITMDYQGCSKDRRDWLWRQGFAHGLTLDAWITPGIVATVRLTGVVRESESPWFAGPVGWVFDELRVLSEPIPHRGAQGLWPVSAEAVAQIEAQHG